MGAEYRSPCPMIKLLTAIALSTLLLSGPSGVFAQRAATAASEQAEEQRVALVIGNSAYKDSPLRNPANDATDVAAALRELGFRVTLRTNASNKQIVTSISEFGQQLKRGGVGLFYYAGHGVQSKGRNYLIPVGASIDSEAELEFEAVDANRVLSFMEEAGNRVNIVILDACRNNPFGRSFRSSSRGLAQMEAAKGSYVAFATAPGSIASDGNARNGLYTQHLLQSLKQPDSDIDKVFRRVAASVSGITNGKQVPWVSSSLTGDFYFRPVTGNAQSAGTAATTSTTAPTKSVTEAKDQSPTPHIALAVPLTAPAPPTFELSSIARLKVGISFKECDVCPELAVIPSGSFSMGTPTDLMYEYPGEYPHQVTIGRQLAVGKYEVTFDEFDACVCERGCEQNPSDEGWGRERRPVINVSWNDAQQYVQWLSRKTGKRYRLLSEAEWEYAARAGSSDWFSWGNRTIFPTQANYNATRTLFGTLVNEVANNQTLPVGSYKPNRFGIYDMHGNVGEWTEDCYNGHYNGAPVDGSAWTDGDCRRRGIRGGSWFHWPIALRSAKRSDSSAGHRDNRTGFRVARTD